MHHLGSRWCVVSKSSRRYSFGDQVCESIGKITFPLATPPGIPVVQISFDIVTADVPALLGLDVLDKESLTCDTVANRLIKRVAVKGR